MSNESYVVAFEKLRMQDVGRVGGKNASLGEMIGQLANAGVRVPGGFATTAQAFRDFLAHGGLAKRIEDKLAKLNVDDVNALAAAGAEIRGWITAQPFPAQLEKDIGHAYAALQQGANDDLSVAVRSSATAEDLPDASFAGQQETFLNIHGLASVLDAVKHVFASLYNDRAISYRVHKNFIHADVALSAGIQRMVRSDLAASGVMFTLDTESGFDQVVFITSAYGLGETVVQGQVNPDEFYVYKPALKAGKKAIIRRNLGSKALRMTFTDSREAGKSVRTDTVSEADRRRFSLTDADVEELAHAALIIEQHYKRAMDIEWGRDGVDGKLYILQARPETVKASEKVDTLRRYRLKQRSDVLASGRAIGQRVGSGPVKLVQSAAEMDRVQPGDVLVTDMTDPDWEPVMKRASAIITNRGGRTCHAAIIARELGIPAVVGCGDATRVLKDGPARHGVVRGRRYRLRLPRHPRSRGDRPVARGDAQGPAQNHDERRQSGARVRVPAPAERRRRPRAARVHHRAHDRRAPEGGAGLSRPAGRFAACGRAACGGLRESGRVLRGKAVRGRGDPRRRILAETGDRAAVGLQIERIFEPDRRLQVRAA
jgi:pyruvate,water dikinase